MKKSRFTETQIVAILKQADAGMPMEQLPGSLGSASQTTTTGSRSMVRLDEQGVSAVATRRASIYSASIRPSCIQPEPAWLSARVRPS